MSVDISLIIGLVRIALGVLFLVSAILKIPRLKKFFVIVVSFGLLKGKLAKAFAYTLPFAELVIASGLIMGFYPMLFSGLALAFLLVSTSGIAFAVYRNKRIDNCGCYGANIKIPVTKKKLVENIVLIIIASGVFVFYVLA
jgi:uncharacterized membrane protein YphA (DoxX/SURF4 family)